MVLDRGQIAPLVETFLVVTTVGAGHRWHRLSRGNVRDSLPQQSYRAQNVSSTEVENLWLEE